MYIPKETGVILGNSGLKVTATAVKVINPLQVASRIIQEGDDYAPQRFSAQGLPILRDAEEEMTRDGLDSTFVLEPNCTAGCLSIHLDLSRSAGQEDMRRRVDLAALFCAHKMLAMYEPLEITKLLALPDDQWVRYYGCFTVGWSLKKADKDRKHPEFKFLSDQNLLDFMEFEKVSMIDSDDDIIDGGFEWGG